MSPFALWLLAEDIEGENACPVIYLRKHDLVI